MLQFLRYRHVSASPASSAYRSCDRAKVSSTILQFISVALGMEFVEVLYKCLEVFNNLCQDVCKRLNHTGNLDENMQLLKGRMEMLSSKQKDIHTKLECTEFWCGKKRKREVENWLRIVENKKNEVQLIQQTVEGGSYFLSSRLQRLVGKNIQEIIELLEIGQFSEGLLIDAHRVEKLDLLTEQKTCELAERNVKELWNCLVNDEIKCIGVCGMGGVGKTTIVTRVHNQLLNHKVDHVYLVPVQQKLNIYKLQGEIAKAMALDISDEENEFKRAAKVFTALKRANKYILILDDVWEHVPLEKLGVPTADSGGKLILTTRQMEVCQKMDCQQIIYVTPLLADEEWSLFVKELGNDMVLAPEVECIAKSVVEECRSFPLLMSAIATRMRGVVDCNEWANVFNELSRPMKDLADMKSQALGFILNDDKLRGVLFYCALFPEDYNIPKVDLIAYWISEGLIDDMDSKQAEFDRGIAILNELEHACLVETAKGGRCVTMSCSVRNMVLAISGLKRQFMVKAGVHLTELPNEIEWSENLERISLMHNHMRGCLPSIKPNCPKLQTLLLQSNCEMQEIPNSFFTHMQELRVLDISYSNIVSLPDSISNLVNLKALLLRNCRKLKYLPSLEKLIKLRELSLACSGTKEVPHGIQGLVNLQCLDLYHMPEIEKFPKGILPSLSHLRCLRLDDCYMRNIQPEELSSLRNLETLGVKFSNLKKFKSYVRTMHWQKLSHYNLQIGHNFYLECGELYGRRVYMADCNLTAGRKDHLVLPMNIQELMLRHCYLTTSLLDILPSLKNAKDLRRCKIQHCPGIEIFWPSISLVEESDCSSKATFTPFFQSLETLVLYDLPNFKAPFWFGGIDGYLPTGTFSSLKQFSVGYCPNVKYLFTPGLVKHTLQNLELVHVYQCSELEQIIMSEEEEKKGERRPYNFPIIKLQKLRSLELEFLPKLKSICTGTIDSFYLQEIRVVKCPMIKRLPLSAPMHDDGQSLQPSMLPSLNKISGEKMWWDLLNWDDPDAKIIFQGLFADVNDKDIFVRSIGRAEDIWKQDLHQYGEV